MNLIDPFQFRDLFRQARSFAVVGNAPTILAHRNGSTIDSHDVVVRFNRATTEGLEDKIGGRTDILVVNAANSRSLAPPPSETVKPSCLVCFVSPQGARTFENPGFADWVGELPLLLSFGPDPIGLSPLYHTRPLTNGTYALFTLLRLFEIERLFVTGFTMFGSAGGATGKYYADPRHNVGAFHDLDQESRLFCELLEQSNAQLDVTDEIRELLAQSKDSNGTPLENKTTPFGSRSLGKRVAARVSWRILKLGFTLRRLAESK